MKMKTIITLYLLLFWVSAQAQDYPTITFDVISDVTQYGTAGPVTERYHLLISIRDLDVSDADSTVVLKNKMFHWSFANYDEGLQTREALKKLKTLVGIENQETIERISAIVKELTEGTKPGRLD